MFRELLSKSGKDLNVIVKASNVPEVAAATSGNERLLLYNQFALDRLQQGGQKDWRLTMLIAHQIGHHASNHDFNLPPELRIEIELEADRFAGYLMFQLGATIPDIQGLTEVFLNLHKIQCFLIRERDWQLRSKGGTMEKLKWEQESASRPEMRTSRVFLSGLLHRRLPTLKSLATCSSEGFRGLELWTLQVSCF